MAKPIKPGTDNQQPGTYTVPVCFAANENIVYWIKLIKCIFEQRIKIGRPNILHLSLINI